MLYTFAEVHFPIDCTSLNNLQLDNQPIAINNRDAAFLGVLVDGAPHLSHCLILGIYGQPSTQVANYAIMSPAELQHRVVLPNFFQVRFYRRTHRQLFMFGQGILLPIVCMSDFDVSEKF